MAMEMVPLFSMFVKLFQTTQRYVVQRPTLLQLNAALERLINEGWERAERPIYLDRRPGAESAWQIELRRGVPLFSKALPLPTERRPKTEPKPAGAYGYKPAAGLI